MLNGGHNRQTSMVWRSVGDTHEPKPFKVWAPKALAMIGSPADTVEDRSIVVHLKRKLKTDKIEGFHERRKAELYPMQRMLARWYEETTPDSPLGFFQIAGGIAGDFPICVVPMLEQDVKRMDVRKWAYFCQISDSTTSYGSYSGAIPNEKITWGKLDVDTPSYVIESDATIVVPLVFAHVLGW